MSRVKRQQHATTGGEFSDRRFNRHDVAARRAWVKAHHFKFGGVMSKNELALQLGVCSRTIQRDIDALEKSAS